MDITPQPPATVVASYMADEYLKLPCVTYHPSSTSEKIDMTDTYSLCSSTSSMDYDDSGSDSSCNSFEEDLLSCGSDWSMDSASRDVMPSPTPATRSSFAASPSIDQFKLRQQYTLSKLMRVDSAPTITMHDSASEPPPPPAFLVARMRRAESTIGTSMSGREQPSKNAQLPFPMQKSKSPNPAFLLLAPPLAGPTSAKQPLNIQSPQETLDKLLKEMNIDCAKVREAAQRAIANKKFFLEMTEANIAAYTMPKIAVIRANDVHTLKHMHRNGEVLQCCNKFGESILHSACRRGSTDCVKYMIEKAGVSLKVVDDCGRTAFHDACWTTEPVLDLVETLLNHCPDLLFIADKRGSYPLQYIRKEHWKAWVTFLEKNKTKLVPREFI